MAAAVPGGRARIDALREQIEDSLVRSISDHHFLPIDKLEEIFTFSAVKDAVQELNCQPERHINLAETIHHNGKAVFAMLIDMGQEDLITRFREYGVLDKTFPLDTTRAQEIVRTMSIARRLVSEVQWKFLPYVFPERMWECRAYIEDQRILPFVSLEKIGSGAFDEVEKIGVYPSQQSFAEKNAAEVHIVRRKRPIASGGDNEFEKEDKCLRLLHGLRHPNIVQFLGSYTHKKEHNFLFPYIETNLSRVLSAEKRHGGFQWDFTFYAALTGLASALAKTHNLVLDEKEYGVQLAIGYFHDLRPPNVLVSHDNFILADFGVGSLNYAGELSNTPHKSLIGDYIAPECTDMEENPQTFTRAVDVWAFGCLILEVVTYMLKGPDGVEEFRKKRITPGRLPRWGDSGFYKPQAGGGIKDEVLEWIEGLRRDTAATDTEAYLMKLGQDALQADPRKRPTMDEMHHRLAEASILKHFDSVQDRFQTARMFKGPHISHEQHRLESLRLAEERFDVWGRALSLREMGVSSRWGELKGKPFEVVTTLFHMLREEPEQRASGDPSTLRSFEDRMDSKVAELWDLLPSDILQRANESLGQNASDHDLHEQVLGQSQISHDQNPSEWATNSNQDSAELPLSCLMETETSAQRTSNPYSSINTSTKASNITTITEEDGDDHSIYSGETTPSLKQWRYDYEAELSKDLLGYLLSLTGDKESLQKVVASLPEHLQRFTRKLGVEDEGKRSREVMRFVRKYRKSIASTLQEELHVDEGLSAPPTNPVQNMPLDEKVEKWLEAGEGHDSELNNGENFDSRDVDIKVASEDDDSNSEDDDSNSEDDDSNSEDDDKDNQVEGALKVDEYRQVVTRSEAYQWLKSDLRRQLQFVWPSQVNIGQAISKEVFSRRIFRNLSRNTPSIQCRVLYQVDWNPVAFLQEQDYGCAPAEAFLKALTLTGIPNEAEGLACSEYIHRNWPQTGESFLTLMELLLTSEEKHNRRKVSLKDGTILVASLDQSKFELEASGQSPDTIVEIGEQLAWVSSSMRSSDVHASATYYRPSIGRAIVTEESDTAVCMSIKLARPAMSKAAESGPASADCWRGLFRNPTIVEGFPIQRREAQPGTGMELSITTIAALTRAKRVNIFKGNCFIKGFCTMLVAVQTLGDIVLWHTLVNKDGSDIKYHDMRVPSNCLQIGEDTAVTLSQLTAMRHVVGWWPYIRSYAGAADANFDIGRCGLPTPGIGFALEKINVGFSRYITANALVALGKRDKPLRFGTPEVYFEKIRCISRKYAVLYDVDERRAWLLDGASVLLHLLRLSLAIDEEDGMAPLHTHKDLCLEDRSGALIEPIQVLRQIPNLKLYEISENEEITGEHKWSGVDRPSDFQLLNSRQVTESYKSTWYRIKDRVDLIYSALDEIFDHHSDVSSSGVSFKLRFSPHSQLEGFEFWDIASGATRIHPYTTTLDSRAEAWVDLVRHLQAITLFGRGYGEILRPMNTAASASNSIPKGIEDICAQWKTLPIGYNYLATSNLILNKILRREGKTDTVGRPWRLVRGVYVHSASPVFDSCNCATDLSKSHRCDRVLVLLKENDQDHPAYRCLPTLPPENGGVIFGQRPANTLKKVDRKGKGKANAAEELPVSEMEVEPADSSIVADSSTGTCRLVGLDSTQPSAVEGSSLLSPGNALSQTSVADASDATTRASLTEILGPPGPPGPEPPMLEVAQAQKRPLFRRAVEEIRKAVSRSPKRKYHGFKQS